MNELTLAMKQMALSEGADLVGVAPVSRYEGAPKILKPQAHLPGARSVVSMAVHHPDASVEWGAEPNSNYPGPFQIGMIPKLDTICLRISRFLEASGHATVPLPCTYYWRHRTYKDVPYCHAASFSHMNAFVAAGLGEYGWHGMVMSPQYGPRQRIISLLTTAELAPDPLYRDEALCDRCGLCEKACWGKNYEPRHLFDPKTISFEIEGKKFEYANVNRWRCFWGEQCHLDMGQLEKEEDLGEEDIYAAVDRGVPRVVAAAAGYMCSSLKHCMAKPVRKWDRAVSPGPRREKAALALSEDDLMEGIVERARAAGADRLTIQPLADLEAIRENIYEGFRTDALFENFEWVVTLGRVSPKLPETDEALTTKNADPSRQMTTGRLMIGILDIARFLDDNGCEGMQMWRQTKTAEVAAEKAGWRAEDDETLFLESVICQAPLKAQTMRFDAALSGLGRDELFGGVRERLPHVDMMGAVSLDDLDFADARALRELAPEARSLIAVGMGFSKHVVDLAGRQEAECAMSYQYVNYQALRETYWAATDLATWLVSQGHAAVPLVDLVPDSVSRPAPYVGMLPDLRAQAPFAAAAGLGGIGRHGFLVTPEFGPRQRFAFVLTNADVPATPAVAETVACPDDCRLCADACPVQALAVGGETDDVLIGNADCVRFARNDVRCEWARAMGMVEEEGATLSGWRVPDLPVPDVLNDEKRKEALEGKDPIQRRCYGRANHADTTVERCLQACPLGRA